MGAAIGNAIKSARVSPLFAAEMAKWAAVVKQVGIDAK